MADALQEAFESLWNYLETRIIETCIDAGLTQTEAADLIYKGLRTWQQGEEGARKMDSAFWELFLMKIDKVE